MKIILTILFVCYFTSERVTDSYRILAIFPFQSKSHSIMAERIATTLVKKGHRVDVVSHFPRKVPLVNYTDISLAGSLPFYHNNLSADVAKYFTQISTQFIVNGLGNTLCTLLHHPTMKELIKNVTEDHPYDLFITEVFFSPCYLTFGRHMKVPIIGVSTSPMYSWLDYPMGIPTDTVTVPHFFAGFAAPMTFIERLINTIQYTYVNMCVNYYMRNQIKDVKQAFGIDIDDLSDLYKDVSLVLVNSHQSLTGIRAFPPSVIEIGGLHHWDNEESLPSNLQKWLDESKDGCIYFTFGSMMRFETFPEYVIKAFYNAFKKIAPIRVLIKVAKKESLLHGLPKNVMIQPWFPQIPVLKHKNIRLFITHAGMLGSLEGVYAGVPMIIFPLYAEQFVNAKRLAQKKVAIQFESIYDITEERLLNMLNTILKDPSYKENMQKLRRVYLDRPMNPVDTVAYWVEYVYRNGNVLQSPAIHLNWWQRNLLDVYGAIALIFFVIFYVLLKITRIFKSVCSRMMNDPKNNNNITESKKNK